MRGEGDEGGGGDAGAAWASAWQGHAQAAAQHWILGEQETSQGMRGRGTQRVKGISQAGCRSGTRRNKAVLRERRAAVAASNPLPSSPACLHVLVHAGVVCASKGTGVHGVRAAVDRCGTRSGRQAKLATAIRVEGRGRGQRGHCRHPGGGMHPHTTQGDAAAAARKKSRSIQPPKNVTQPTRDPCFHGEAFSRSPGGECAVCVRNQQRRQLPPPSLLHQAPTSPASRRPPETGHACRSSASRPPPACGAAVAARPTARRLPSRSPPWGVAPPLQACRIAAISSREGEAGWVGQRSFPTVRVISGVPPHD